MNAVFTGLVAVVLLSTCFGGSGPFGGEIIIHGEVNRYFAFDRSEGASVSRNNMKLYIGADSINTPDVDPGACLYLVQLTVYEEDRPEIYERLFSLHQEDTLEGAYIEFRGITTMTDHPQEIMVPEELVYLRPAPAGEVWSDDYCSAGQA